MVGMCVISTTRAQTVAAGEIRKSAPARTTRYIRRATTPTVITTLSQSSNCMEDFTFNSAMATQHFVDSQTMQTMNQTRLQTEVSNGTYKFTRPLTIVNCATQEKYIVYASCPHCLKGVLVQNNGYYCPVHHWQSVPVYRFALRILLVDGIETELWSTVFDETAAKALGFSANSYVAMTSDEERYASLSLWRGTRVIVTIKKRINGTYINYTVSELEVLDGPFSLYENKENAGVTSTGSVVLMKLR